MFLGEIMCLLVFKAVIFRLRRRQVSLKITNCVLVIALKLFCIRMTSV